MSWKPIKTAKKEFLHELDLWIHVRDSLRSIGVVDSFRIPNAYWMDKQPKGYRNNSLRDNFEAGWFHYDKGKHRRLNGEYITHWMPIPKPPK